VVREGKEHAILELHPELRHELATARVAALRRSAEPSPAGPLRRALGSGLVRLGLRLGYDGRVPPFVAQRVTEDRPPAPAGGPFGFQPRSGRFAAVGLVGTRLPRERQSKVITLRMPS
jgi:hypothetical protein